LPGGNRRRFSFVSNGSDTLLCSGQRRVSTFSRGLCLNFGRQYDRRKHTPLFTSLSVK
jgi:hypothetical protein